MNEVKKTRGFERARAAIKFVSVNKTVSKEDKIKLLQTLQEYADTLILDLIFEEDK